MHNDDNAYGTKFAAVYQRRRMHKVDKPTVSESYSNSFRTSKNNANTQIRYAQWAAKPRGLLLTKLPRHLGRIEGHHNPYICRRCRMVEFR